MRRTPKTITTRTALRAELERVVAGGGMPVEDEEHVTGRRALAAAVSDKRGWPVAAVELAVPTEAHTCTELLEQLGPKVTATAQQIGLALD